MYEYKNILIVRYGEISLKGMNKPYFERVLEGRIKSAAFKMKQDGTQSLSIVRSDGLITVSGRDKELPVDSELLMKTILKVFGVASVSPAVRLEDKHLETISAAAVDFMRTLVKERQAVSNAAGDGGEPVTFKIIGKRSDKSYPITSPDISARVGEAVLNELEPAVKVDVIRPEVALNIHLRQREVFIYDEKFGGFGGLPLGTNGKGMVLLSGGIDSPVAAWLMAKRGMRVEAVHYHSYPYTGKRAQEKVEELAAILSEYVGRFRMHVINLLPAQEAIAKHCPEELMTILVRRFMMKIAERIAASNGCNMLVTGESLGQVASQTAESLFVTDDAVSLPVMRPLIAAEKVDIMDKAQEIGTYEKSIEPYEDCCTVFLPRHPATKPKMDDVLAAESAIDGLDELLDELVNSEEIVIISG
jgi:thiamine biosynthesis protein ThiI